MKIPCIWHSVRAFIHVAMLRPLVTLLFGVHVSGWENLQSVDRFIMIANHNSHFDVLLLFYLLSVRDIEKTHPVAEEAYFARSKFIFRLVTFLFQPVWIKRGTARRYEDVLQGCKAVLDSGHNLIVFPEGTRGTPGELGPFKSGIGRLIALYPERSIVPVYLSGPERVLPRTCVLPLPFSNEVVVGPPQVCTGSHHDITRHLQTIVSGLSEASRLRQRPRLRRLRKTSPTLAILGIDGSGKSTVSKMVAKNLSEDRRVCLVSDHLEFYEERTFHPLQPSGLDTIRQMVSRHAKRADSLKNYKIPKLTELLLRDRLLVEVNRWYAVGAIVQDGSPLLNMAAWAALYAGHETKEAMLLDGIAVLAGKPPQEFHIETVLDHYPEIRSLSRLGLNHMNLPRAYVILDLPPEVACDRIQRRGNPLQPHETVEHLGKLREAYLTVHRLISRRWTIPVLVIDGCQPLESTFREAADFLRANFEPESGAL